MPVKSQTQVTPRRRSTARRDRLHADVEKKIAAINPDELDRANAAALYMQVAERLRAQIDDGTFPPDSKLPAESELTQRFSVSRVTVRKALAHLLENGYVTSRQGKGTFVCRHRLLHDLKPMRGFYDALVAQGVEPKTKLLEFAPVVTPSPMQQAFGVTEGECFRLRRLYFIDDKPIALVEALLPPQASGLTWEQASSNPIYALLEKLLALPVTRAELRIRARPAGAVIARALGVGARAALLVMDRESFGSSGVLREKTSFYIRPENYEFALSVQGTLPVGSSIKNVSATAGDQTE